MVITVRRRIGKNKLALHATDGEEPTVYLFISRKNEASLCAEFIPLIASALKIFVPSSIKSLEHNLIFFIIFDIPILGFDDYFIPFLI